MVRKIPKKIVKKWNRFTKLEKIFIVYSFVLLISFFLFPIISSSFNWVIKVFLFNRYMIKIDIVIFFLLVFLLSWNISFRFKNLISLLIWFKENDALINFILLWVISVCFLTIWDLVVLFSNTLSWSLKLCFWYYVIWSLLVFGLIWNLILVLDWLKIKKKVHIVNFKNYNNLKEEERKESFKWLFNN